MNRKTIFRGAAFVLISLLLVKTALGILVRKSYMKKWASPLPVYSGFYDLKKNTVDVLFLGSSHSYSSFCPQLLYDEYGITSYNLAMGNQSIPVNYFWLVEALKTQSPKAVVLEGAFLFRKRPGLMNTKESATQKSLSYMKWSLNKIEAIRAIGRIDPEETFSSFLPHMRYHWRWKELKEEDFTAAEIRERNELKGYTAELLNEYGEDDYVPYGDTGEKRKEMLPEMAEYLDKITELCGDSGIRLILTLTPTTSASGAKHNTLRDYADAHDLLFLDYNKEDVIREIKYRFSGDNADYEHVNVRGARKITRKMGDFLTEKMIFVPHTDPQWEETRDYYRQKVRDFMLRRTDDFAEWLGLLNPERQTIVFSVKGCAPYTISEEAAGALASLGLRTDLRDTAGKNYLAVIDSGAVVCENCSENGLVWKGTVRKDRSLCEVRSAGASEWLENTGYAGNTDRDASSIRIDRGEKSRTRTAAKGRSGLNIVVMSNENCKILDTVCFDWETGEALR